MAGHTVTVEHRIHVTGPDTYHATCTCGYGGDGHGTERTAWVEADQHIRHSSTRYEYS